MKACVCEACGQPLASARFPVDAKIYLLHYGDGLSIADIGGALGVEVGRVAATIRAMDSVIMRSAIRPRPSGLCLKDAVGMLVASEILTDPGHKVDPDVRRGLMPRLTFAEMRRRSKIASRATKRRRERNDYEFLKIKAADYLRTYWLYQPKWVLAAWRDLVEAEKTRRNPTTYIVRMSCTGDDCTADSVEVPLETIVSLGGTPKVVCGHCDKRRMVLADHRTNATGTQVVR